MTGAVLRTLYLELRRDRGALIMAFVLPVVFFLVFAWIFAGTAGGNLRIRLVVADSIADDDTRALLAALAADASIEVVAETDPAAARALVRRGSADAGLVVRGALRNAEAGAPPPVLLLFDPTRGVAAAMLAGRIQRAYVQALPDVALGEVIAVLDARFLDLDPDQRTRLEVGLRALRQGTQPEQRDLFGALYEREAVIGNAESVNHIAYYAGAVAILFVLFSAVHGAITLLEDRDAGIVDRILAGPAGIRVLVDARFAFLTAQGFVQVLIIYLVAWVGYGVDLPGHLLGWTLTTVAVSLCAAGLALALVAACGSRRQAQTVSNVAILILSAVGGSMVPRFFMPPLLQDLGWLTPNTWGLEAYTGVFWRGDAPADLVLPIGLLLGAALGGLLLARALARRWEVV
ncbi:MAG: ABC transporter permease [Planctomycetota bacterium]|nr:ABC transporter permease [Planctomycetota bacterium]